MTVSGRLLNELPMIRDFFHVERIGRIIRIWKWDE